MDALDLLSRLGYWSIDGIWIPLLVWSFAALPIACLLIGVQRGDTNVRYALTMALLASLPIGMMLAQTVTGNSGAATPILAISLPEVFVETAIVGEPQTALPWTAVHTAGIMFVVAALMALHRLIRLSVDFSRLIRLRRVLKMEPAAQINRLAASIANRLDIDRPVDITLSHHIRTPMTFGWRRPAVILPASLARTPHDLRLALVHELVHVRRRDYVLQWVEQLIGAFFIIHPLVALLRQEASILRESSCDADVISLVGNRATYARLLYRFSTHEHASGAIIVGISLKKKHLYRRIQTMKNSTGAHRRSVRRVGLTLAGLLFGISVGVVACSENVVSEEAESGSAASAEADGVGYALTPPGADDVFVIVEQMPQLVGGLQSVQQNLRYPQEARDEGIEGRVIVQFIVDEEGSVTDPIIVKGIDPRLDEAALQATAAAEFLPGRQRGEPVKVKMSLPITFRLARGGDNIDDSGAHGRMGSRRDQDVTMPELIGGLQSLQQRIRYPESARAAGIEGRVMVQLSVDKSGAVSEAEIVRGVGYGLDEEALRVARMATFIPGAVNGEPTEVKLSLPFTFQLGASSVPPASDAPDRDANVPSISLEVLADNRLLLMGRPIAFERVTEVLLDVFDDPGDQRLSVRVAPGASPEFVRSVQDRIRAAGPLSISYSSHPEE